jgi:para-aminobenzoate synthetase/4-amino-4-deoxychorismate lyase
VAIYNLALNMSRDDYINSISKVRKYIREGDTYQVNFTLKYRFQYQGNAIALYQRLRERQRVEFGALLNFPEFTVLSLSPELFLRKKGTRLESKPMKGTAARGSSPEQDATIVASMKQDAKTQSENVMIVDLIRSDIGRVSDLRSVGVKDMFEVQTYETLHQMISTVHGNVAPDISFAEVLRHLFPCGSITGAPKIRTMQIIEELEAEHRGIYTGAIGYLTPDNDFCFNVPIRTCVAYHNGTAEMGVGSGIIYEANAQAEFEECLLKARFLTGINSYFQLLESMYYQSATGTIPKLAEHVSRLVRSAEVFHFSFNQEAMIDAVHNAIKGLHGDHKVRVALEQSGHLDIQITRLEMSRDSTKRPYIEISLSSVNSRSLWLRYKTTERRLYDAEYEKYSAQGAYEVLFLNEFGQFTEASRHNLFIEKNGYLFTPPVKVGLLEGVERKALMEQEGICCIEKVLKAEDLLDADRILLTNAVRGVVEVQLSVQALNMLTKLAEEEKTYAMADR